MVYTHDDDQGSFDLELLVNLLVLDWVVLQSFVVLIAVCDAENVRRKVRILSVLSK